MHKIVVFLLFLCGTLTAGTISSIPVLDMGDFENPQTRLRFIRQLKNASQEGGYFALLNFNVEDALLKTAYRSAESFFRLDKKSKLTYCDRKLAGQRGYVPGEIAKGKVYADYKEFFSIGRESNCPNIWPEELNLKQTFSSLFQEIENRRRRLEEAFAEAVGQPKEFFTEMTREGESLLRFLHFPSRPPSGCFWAAPHTNINLFTIFFRATGQGLQFKNKEGEWIEVIVPEKAVIIGCGDMLENLTNGMFRSAVHRVHNSGRGGELFAIECYTHARFEDRMDPLPLCISMTGGKSLYAAATARELLHERLVDLGLATYEVMEHLAKSGLMQRLEEVGRASPQALAALKNAGFIKDLQSDEMDQIPLSPISDRGVQ